MIHLVLYAALAAIPIRLDEVRAEARRNPQALQSALDFARASENTRSVRANVLPQVSLSASGGYEATGTQNTFVPIPNDPNNPNAGFHIGLQDESSFSHRVYTLQGSLTQLLFDWSRFKSLAQAGASEAAAKAQAQEQLDFAEYEAIRRFYALFTAQKSRQVLQASAQRSKELVERSNALFEAGHGSKLDVLSAEVNLNNDRIAALRQETAVTQAQADLAGWIGRRETDDLEAVDPGLEAAPAPAPELAETLRQAHAHRPLLKVVAAQLEAANDGVSSAAGGYAPRLNLQARYTRFGYAVNPVFTDPSRQNDLLVSLNLQWDLFSGFATDAQVKTAQHVRSQAEITAEQTGRDVEGAVKIARTALEVLVQVADIARVTEETAARGLVFAKERFSAGAASTLEVRDAQLKLTQSELNQVTSRSDVEVARGALARLTGTLNTEVQP